MARLQLSLALFMAIATFSNAQVNFPGRGRRPSYSGGGFPSFPPSTPNFGAGFQREIVNPADQTGASVACTDYNGQAGECVAAVSCSAHFEELITRSGGVPCQVADGSNGVCCPAKAKTAGRGNGAVLPEAEKEVEIRSFSAPEISSATSTGSNMVTELYELEKRLMASGQYLAKETPASYHQAFLRTSKVASDLGHTAMGIIEASKDLAKRSGLTNAQDIGVGLRQLGTSGSQSCPRRTGCPRSASRFRTIDGSCNNIGQPEWGKSNTGFQRIALPTYNDGIFEPRSLSVTGQRLPSARAVSAATISDANKPDREFTALVTQFGQFLDHDLTHIGVFQLDPENNVGIQCCRNGQLITPSPHPACLPIDIPANDRFFSRFGRRCMEFVRALPAPRSDCSLGFADQLNTNSHFLDASAIYGSSDTEARGLRSFRNGLLAVQATRASSRPILPAATTESDGCTNITQGVRCFRAGDNRVNEQPGLTLIHLVWVREHNRVAAELQTLNPNWSDEQLYQEAKAIVTAEWVHVVYNEWLPLILGPTYMTNFNLFPQRFGFSQDYDPSINPSITNEFATAAFRFGHTLLQSVIPVIDPRTGSQNVELLRNNFNTIQAISGPRAVEGLLRGFTVQPMQSFDGCVTEDVTNQLFRTNNPFGLDLVALNTQRGRDHGLPTYNDMREVCGLGRARSFRDLVRDMPEENVRRFQSVYAHPDDIDLFVGGVSENSVPDAVLGPTFLCIIGDQFTRLKRGDRFFYEFNLGPQSFNEAQLQEIRKTSFARILCDNTDVGDIQPLAFIRPFPGFNDRQRCNSPVIPRVNLAVFRGA